MITGLIATLMMVIALGIQNHTDDLLRKLNDTQPPIDADDKPRTPDAAL